MTETTSILFSSVIVRNVVIILVPTAPYKKRFVIFYVLMGNYCDIKIADFGISRNLGTYETPQDARLPIKWTVPEILQHESHIQPTSRRTRMVDGRGVLGDLVTRRRTVSGMDWHRFPISNYPWGPPRTAQPMPIGSF